MLVRNAEVLRGEIVDRRMRLKNTHRFDRQDGVQIIPNSRVLHGTGQHVR